MAKESSSYALLLDNLPTEQVQRLDNAGHRMLKLSSQLVYASCITHGIPHKHCASYLRRLTIPSHTSLYQECSSINNLSNDTPGKPYRRLLPAAYSDGLEKMRRTKNNHHLPHPRNISNHLYEGALATANEIRRQETLRTSFSPEGILDMSRNVFFVQWSQFVEHDLVNTVQHKHGNKHQRL